MRKLLATAAIAVLQIVAAHAQQKMVTISGRLIHFNNQAEVEDLSEFEYLDIPSPDRIIVADSTGKFNISFNLSAPNYFRLGRNILYLTPGDKLTATIDKDNAAKSTFAGIGADANNYLVNTPFPKAGSYLVAGSAIKPQPQQTLQLIMDRAAERKKQLSAVQNVSAEFIRLETARIKADVLNSINSVLSYAVTSKNVTSVNEYVDAFNKLADSTKKEYQKNFIDASLMKLMVYRDIADGLVENAATSADVQKINDWYKATGIVELINHGNDKTKLAAYNKTIDSIKTTVYRNALKRHLKNLLQFGKGDVAVNFTAVDINGKKVALTNLKGKVIYVDIWATWCGPCLAEMPHLEEIKGKYSNNPNVVFVSLSIDDDGQADEWKKNVAARKAGGLQWQINREKLNAYNITTIPRTLLIDKNFKMVSMNAPLPSSKELAATIDGLIN